MNILVIGGVAAGTKTAAKLKRENRDYNVTIITMGKDISYAGCGLPYYVGGVIENKESLIINTPENFEKLTQVKVITNTEVLKINRDNKTVITKNTVTSEEKEFKYDKLVIATGADPIKPKLDGINLKGIYYVRTPEDAIKLRSIIENEKIKRVVVVGGGFIGLEIAENLLENNIKTTVIDANENIPPGFDKEVSLYLQEKLIDNGIMILTNEKVVSIIGDEKVSKVKTNKRAIKADLVIMSVGIKPNTKIAEECGLNLEDNKTISVDYNMQTSDENIFAVGDCASVKNIITNKSTWSPMGSSANKEGRCVARTIAGKESKFNGVLGTSIVKLLDISAARTGLTEKDAISLGYNTESVIVPLDDKAHYYPGSGLLFIKLIADIDSEKILGAQVFGKGSVDKQIDTVATSIHFGGKLSDLQDLDLAYAPPFSTAISPLGHAANVLLNKITEGVKIVRFEDFIENKDSYKIVDVNKVPTLENALYLDLSNINGKIENLDYDDKILLVCARGKRAYLTYNKMKYYGYKDVNILEGGLSLNKEVGEL
ncbi:pyridine nucleotide-disulfide oxidoreductase [Romboutsia ilealis]|uniref:FAD-dependent oxidoreductase n=1 Tax=Romboutsia faecis TaxID=2764597 RepID=A0ABR7JLW9_9FIRM|nr:FAD-dependent oxidoreductase [Romboutsia faecis]MBC5995895.1 FAD-dependent oxidoreductase [Romboutsia faecis]MRN23095.1 pyridine nucleotide-disulfide oxidoreductase [Romboutsia ilealis]